MIDAESEFLAGKLGPQREDVKRLMRTAARSDNGARIAKSRLRAELRRAGLPPDDDDPFTAVFSPDDLGGDGVNIGAPVCGGPDLIWRYEEIPYSALFLSDPGFGKTSLILHLLIQLAVFYTIIIADLRGDYECLCRLIPNARYFSFGDFPINLLRGAHNVPPKVFHQKFSEVFTDQFDQRQSSSHPRRIAATACFTEGGMA